MTVLVVEDEALQARSIKRSLERQDYEVLVASSAEDGLDVITTHHPDVVLTDLRLPGMDGLALLKRVREMEEAAQVIMMTAHGNVRIAVEAMRLGAYDYVTKPLDLEELALLLERLGTHERREQELSYLREKSGLSSTEQFPLGKSPQMQTVLEQIRKFVTLERTGGGGAPSVLLLGETGTGKGYIASVIHNLSPRKAQPFIEVNCAALPITLLEAELFGHEKGAFTDAKSAKRGLFEAADRGTIFLDEIGQLSPETQAKLLTVIESHTFRRLGSVVERHVDTRILAATNLDLDDAVARGTFRADLYHRLNVLSLRLPPLRERGEDGVLLANHFVGHHCRQYGLTPRRISREAKERIRLYKWPGNVRELANEIERALLLETGEELSLAQIPLPSAADKPNEVRIANSAGLNIELPPSGIPFANIERQVFLRALEMCEWNVARTARFLSLSRDTLRYRIERLGLQPEDTAAKSSPFRN